MASSIVAGDGAYPTRAPSRDVNLGPVLEDTPPLLRFAVGRCPQEFPLADAPAFISSIDDALARNADEQLGQLEISLVFRPGQYYRPRLRRYAKEHPHAALIKAHHVRAWLRYGMARAEESFVLEVPPCPPGEEHEAIALDLPATAVAEAMVLTLSNATLTLPAPAEASFRNLTDLLLGNARIVDGGGRLGELLSSFPCLQRLRLEHLVGVKELDLRTDELEHLAIVGARDLRCLEVNAQSLFTLTVTDCSKLDDRPGLVYQQEFTNRDRNCSRTVTDFTELFKI
jgi:hypothetical protein